MPLQTVWLIIGSKVKTFQGKKVVLLELLQKENMAHSRDWWELHPYSPPKEETDTWQTKKCALFPKMTFSLMSPTTPPKQQPVSQCNQAPTALSLDTLCFCCWNMKPFYNKTISVSYRNDYKPNNNESQFPIFFSPDLNFLTGCESFCRVEMKAWQQLSAGPQLSITTDYSSQHVISSDCKKYILSSTED